MGFQALLNTTNKIKEIAKQYRDSGTKLSWFGVGGGTGIGLLSLKAGAAGGPVGVAGALFFGTAMQIGSDQYNSIADIYDSLASNMKDFIANQRKANTFKLSAIQYDDMNNWKTNPIWKISAIDSDGNEIESFVFKYWFHDANMSKSIIDPQQLNTLMSSMFDDNVDLSLKMTTSDEINLPESELRSFGSDY